MGPNKITSTFYMDKELFNKAKDIAWMQRKSFSQFLSEVLQTAVEKLDKDAV